MRVFLTVVVLVMTFYGFMLGFGAKTITEKNNGTRLACAGVLALAFLARCW